MTQKVIMAALRIMLDSRTPEPEAMVALRVVRQHGMIWSEVFELVRADPPTRSSRVHVHEAPRQSEPRAHQRPRPKQRTPGTGAAWDYRMRFGKYKGVPLGEIYVIEYDYLEWLDKQDWVKPGLREALNEILE